jgi:hypothetical protein
VQVLSGRSGIAEEISKEMRIRVLNANSKAYWVDAIYQLYSEITEGKDLTLTSKEKSSLRENYTHQVFQVKLNQEISRLGVSVN